MKCKCGEHELVKSKKRTWRRFVEYLKRGVAMVHTEDLCRSYDWN